MKRIFYAALALGIIVLAGNVVGTALVAVAATTISTDISTGGTLSVTGTTTLLGKVGVGTTTPTSALTLIGNLTTAAELEIHNNYANGINLYSHADLWFRGPRISLNRSEGTQSAPAAIKSGDILGYFQYGGHNGSTYIGGATIEAVASADWSGVPATPGPTYLDFYLGNAFAGVPSMRLTSGGSVGINVSVPTGALEVAAVPVTATTTVVVGGPGTKGSCLVLFDVVGTQKFVTIQGGALVVSDTSCR